MSVQHVNDASYTLDKSILTYDAFGEKKRILLDEKAKDFCIGKYGDGCGGGRIFILYEACVKVYEEQGKEIMTLLDGLNNTKSIDKEECILKIATDNEYIYYDLSTMKKETHAI